MATTPPPARTALALLLALLAVDSRAQIQPDAGTLWRESERGLQAPRVTESVPQPAAVQPGVHDSDALRIRLKHVAIDGATLVPEVQLQVLLQGLIGQSLTLAELERAALHIAEHYREHGWYARVYLPEQDVTDGRLRIQVIEGRYGTSHLRAHRGLRANGALVQQVMTRGLQPGEPLSAAALERGVLLANDLPGIRAQGVLQAGQHQGHSDLLVSVEDTAYVTGDAMINSYGVRSTGPIQTAGGLAVNNPSGRGDQWALRMMVSAGVRSVLTRYSLPLCHDGLRLAAHSSLLRYRLSGSYESLEATGQAHAAGMTLSFPLVRQIGRNLSWTAGYERRRYRDVMLGAALRRHAIHSFTLGLNGNLHDAWGGGGLSWVTAQFTRGSLAIADVGSDRAQDAAGPRSQGNYGKLSVQLGRMQVLAPGWRLEAIVSGQTANGNLASSERMSLGGPQQVRAFPANEADGDHGALLKLELQRALGHGWQGIVFYDTGRIRLHHRPWAGWDAGSGRANHYSLSGAGLGIQWRGRGPASGLQFMASLAAPVGGNPGHTQGRNSDGSKTGSARGWLGMQLVF